MSAICTSVPCESNDDEDKEQITYDETALYGSTVDNRPWILKKCFPTGYSHELRSTLSLAWPIVLTQIMNNGMQTVAIMMGGHLGKIELDAVTLANTLINIMGIVVAMGASTACDTSFSQTFGSGNKKMLGIYLQRSIIILLLILCVTLTLSLNVEWILHFLDQDPVVSQLVGLYMLVFIPGFLSNFMYIVVRKYLQCQDVVYPHITIGCAGLGLHALLQYLLLYQAKLGILGSSLAQGSGFVIMFIGTLLYTLGSGIYKETWGGWSWQCLEDWGNFFKLAVFGILMTCLEWWAFEIFIILAGVLGTTELGAAGIAVNLDLAFYSIPFGIGIASCIRVGQQLGAGQPRAALNASNVGMSIVAFTSVIASTLFATLHWELPKLFTEDNDVIEAASQLLPMIALYTFFDNFGAVARGVFQGAGRQGVGTIVVFISYYILGLPIGIPLMFLTPLGLQGMWAAMTGAVILTSLVFFCLLLFVFDWQKMSEQAKLRAGVLRHGESQKNIDNSTARYDEKTPILGEKGVHGDRRLSHGYTEPNIPISSLDIPNEQIITKSLILKRFVTIATFLGILALGIILRVVAPFTVSGDNTDTSNSTLSNSMQQLRHLHDF